MYAEVPCIEAYDTAEAVYYRFGSREDASACEYSISDGFRSNYIVMDFAGKSGVSKTQQLWAMQHLAGMWQETTKAAFRNDERSSNDTLERTPGRNESDVSSEVTVKSPDDSSSYGTRSVHALRLRMVPTILQDVDAPRRFLRWSNSSPRQGTRASNALVRRALTRPARQAGGREN